MDLNSHKDFEQFLEECSENNVKVSRSEDGTYFFDEGRRVHTLEDNMDMAPDNPDGMDYLAKSVHVDNALATGELETDDAPDFEDLRERADFTVHREELAAETGRRHDDEQDFELSM